MSSAPEWVAAGVVGLGREVRVEELEDSEALAVVLDHAGPGPRPRRYTKAWTSPTSSSRSLKIIGIELTRRGQVFLLVKPFPAAGLGQLGEGVVQVLGGLGQREAPGRQ